MPKGYREGVENPNIETPSSEQVEWAATFIVRKTIKIFAKSYFEAKQLADIIASNDSDAVSEVENVGRVK